MLDLYEAHDAFVILHGTDTMDYSGTALALLLNVPGPFGLPRAVLSKPVILTGAQLPELVLAPIELISGASIPAMLLAFGISLVGSKPLDPGTGRRADVLIGSLAKLVIHPLIAWLLAAFVFRLPTEMIVAAVIMAGLPTAQNIFVTASRYEHGVVIAKDTVLMTTICAIPLMMALALLLGI